jgi:hypothetical protein
MTRTSAQFPSTFVRMTLAVQLFVNATRTRFSTGSLNALHLGELMNEFVEMTSDITGAGRLVAQPTIARTAARQRNFFI